MISLILVQYEQLVFDYIFDNKIYYYLIQKLFKFSWPFLHKRFNIWHIPVKRGETANTRVLNNIIVQLVMTFFVPVR